jgi:hypothetical protein
MNIDHNYRNRKSDKDFIKFERRPSDRDRDDYFRQSISIIKIGDKLTFIHLDLKDSEIYKFNDDLDSDQD